jgi:D-alanyl-D-alanine dipeptidase
MKMSENKKEVAKGYKLAKGAAVDIPKAGLKNVTNDQLKNPTVIALIARKAPEAFGTLIIPA